MHEAVACDCEWMNPCARHSQTAAKLRCFVVDDVPLLCQPMVSLLQKSGRFHVRGFEDPAEALRAFGNMRSPLDLLVTDYQMPGMNGMELAREARLRFPKVRVLLMSGKVACQTKHTQGQSGADAFLPKPFSSKEFLDAVRSLVGAEWFS
jgi:two-component system, cell cycle sensor histidine kinase and response regulator CckA